MLLRKDQLEAQLHAEKEKISDGRLKDDSPLDLSQTFATLCEACRRGDLKVCQEKITKGVNINARDRFDYTPLILVRESCHSCRLTQTIPLSSHDNYDADADRIRPVSVAIMKSCSYYLSLERCVNVTRFKARG